MLSFEQKFKLPFVLRTSHKEDIFILYLEKGKTKHGVVCSYLCLKFDARLVYHYLDIHNMMFRIIRMSWSCLFFAKKGNIYKTLLKRKNLASASCSYLLSKL